MEKFPSPSSKGPRREPDEPLESLQAEQAWQEVYRLMAAAPQFAPAPGFAARWEARRMQAQISRHRRQTWTILSVVAGLALLSLGTLLIFAIGRPEVLKMTLLVWLVNMGQAIELASSSLEIAGAFLRSWVGVVGLVIVVLLTGIASVIGVLWAATLQKLTAARRVFA